MTALYRGKAHGTLPSRLEALGIATDFQAGVLLSKMIEGGLHYGLGSTLAVRREALEVAGGLLPLVDHLADDYELGARVARAGYRVELSAEVVETAVPAYGWRGFFDHQLRWLRTVRDARPWGYAGLIFTHGLGWALVNVLASGLSPVSLWLLGLSFFLRLAQAMTVGAEVLGDHEVLDEFVAAARSRCDRYGTLGGWVCRKHNRVARRAVYPQTWEAQKKRVGRLEYRANSPICEVAERRQPPKYQSTCFIHPVSVKSRTENAIAGHRRCGLKRERVGSQLYNLWFLRIPLTRSKEIPRQLANRRSRRATPTSDLPNNVFHPSRAPAPLLIRSRSHCGFLFCANGFGVNSEACAQLVEIFIPARTFFRS